jgi:hypothetical protein
MEVTVGIRVEVEEEEMVVEVEVEETVSNVGSQVTGPENALVVVVAAAVAVAGILLGMVILEGKELHTKPISACVFSFLFILD